MVNTPGKFRYLRPTLISAPLPHSSFPSLHKQPFLQSSSVHNHVLSTLLFIITTACVIRLSHSYLSVILSKKIRLPPGLSSRNDLVSVEIQPPASSCWHQALISSVPQIFSGLPHCLRKAVLGSTVRSSRRPRKHSLRVCLLGQQTHHVRVTLITIRSSGTLHIIRPLGSPSKLVSERLSPLLRNNLPQA